jgi:hypothetical protein
VVGFDQREAISYHTFCQSVLEKASIPVRFMPLAENTLGFYKERHANISNRFVFSRFLTPYLADYQGMAVFADGELRITSVDEFPVTVNPSRHMLFTRHRDMPGIIGKLGSLLGQHNVNIASMQVGRRIVRGDAVMVLSVDDPIPSDLLTAIHAIEGIQTANPVTL